MAIKPDHNAAPHAPANNQTAIAIGASFLIAVILGSVVAGSPFRAFRLAYIDYSHTPAAAAAPAPTTAAPAAEPPKN